MAPDRSGHCARHAGRRHPGVSSALILAIVLPATLWMSLLSSLIFMTAIYTGAAFGVAIPAILMGVPGSPAAVATSFDGYPMTQRGDHNLALGLALAASTSGTWVRT